MTTQSSTSTRGRKPKATTTPTSTAKATPAPAVTASVAEKQAYNAPIRYKRKEVEVTNTEYEIPKGGGIVYLIPQKGVTIYDRENDTVREIRYCPNEPSIFVDEQSDNAVKEAIIFRNGKLFVPKEKPNLKKFLDAHPSNFENGGKVFKAVNVTRDAEAELDKEFATIEAVSFVREKDINDLLPVAIFYGININKSSSEIKFDLLKQAKSNPQDFISSFDSPTVKARSIIYQASEYQILKVTKSSVRWFDNNKEIISVPVGEDPIDIMTRFCLTDKGSVTFEAVKEKMSRI